MGEIWKDIPEYEDKYQVSNLGRVKSLSRIVNIRNGKRVISERILSICNMNGYMSISLSKNNFTKSFLIHRVIANAFIEKVIGKNDINHKNGIKTDNRIENLEWCTKSENSLHSYKIGLQSKQGSKHHLNKLDENDVLEIRSNLNHLKLIEVASLFSVSIQTICDIRKKRTWIHV